MKNKIEFPTLTVSLLEEGIVQADFKKIKEMTTEHVDQLYDAVAKLSDEKKVGFLVSYESYIPMNDEVMEYARQEKFQKYVLASASIIKSTALRVAVNFYWTFHKPKSPRKIFDSKESALTWLRKIRDEVLVPVEH